MERETQALHTWECCPVSRGLPAEWSHIPILRDNNDARSSLQQLMAPNITLPTQEKILLTPCLAFQWDVGSNRAQQLGTLGKQAKTQRGWALGTGCFRSIMAAWVCLA